jgi:hypothetical protein
MALRLSLFAIFALTLLPTHGAKHGPTLGCPSCERGVADLILNVALFVPFGLALAADRIRVPRAFLIGALLSAAIELAQLWIPGRQSSLSDVISNALGTGLGSALPIAWMRLVGRAQGNGTWLTLGAASLAAVIATGTGLLLRPVFPDSVYYGQWTPNLRNLAWYRGRVLEARLGPIAIPSTRMDSAHSIARLLASGAPVRVRAIAGPPVRRLAPLLSVYDDAQREIFLLGPDRGDLAFRFRTRSTAWRLDQPDVRARGALATVRPGDTLSIVVSREGAGYCVQRDAFRACRLGFTAGRGWSLLAFPEELPEWAMQLLDAGWIAGLLIPLGLCARRRTVPWAGAALFAGLALAPAVAGLEPSPASEWLGGVLGSLLGIRLRALQPTAFGARAQPGAR